MTVPARARWRPIPRLGWWIIGVVGCLITVVVISHVDRSTVPVVTDLPRARGLRVVTAVEAGSQFNASLPGRWRYIALAAPASSTGAEAVRREVHRLERDGWTDERTLLVSESSGVVLAHTVPVGTQNSLTELDDPVHHLNVTLTVAPTSFVFPQALWHSAAIARAAHRDEPILQAQLGTGRENRR